MYKFIGKHLDEIYKYLVRPVLFMMDPERAHKLVLDFLSNKDNHRYIFKLADDLIYENEQDDLKQSLMGRSFNTPLGLAAGFDKNATIHHSIWHQLGFSFVEYGSVTSNPREGNPAPRMFRLPEDDAIVNRMGLNNRGAKAVSACISDGWVYFPVGVSIAKSPDAELGIYDQAETYSWFKDKNIPYIVFNISCPNTAEGIETEVEDIRELLSNIHNPMNKWILLKVSPDSDFDFIDQLLALPPYLVDGFIVGNTTAFRKDLKTSASRLKEIGNGGLSGKPLKNKAIELVRYMYRFKDPGQLLIGCGGIFDGQDAYEYITAGASLVQIYTSYIYRGPTAPRRIAEELSAILKREGLTLKDAIGSKSQDTITVVD